MFPIGDENEPGHGPAFATLAIIALNVFVFLVLQGASGPSGDRFTYGYSAVPYEITHGTDLTQPTEITVNGQTGSIPQEPGPVPIWLTLLTSMFMHGGWLHIGGNMLFLWVFGDNVEDAMGHVKYLLFYLACGAFAALMHAMVAPNSDSPLIGASGAVAGVIAAYIMLHPRVRVWVLAFKAIPLRISAAFALGAWILMQLVMAFLPQSGPVAWWAHIGGLLAGAALVLVLRRPGEPLFDKGLTA